jgi:hypothetical protein
VRWRLKVRSYLVVLALAALLPVVTFGSVAIVRLAHLERAASEQTMREMARALSLAVDRELAGTRSTLLFLATSPHLRSGDLVAFHRQAIDAVTLRGSAIVLSTKSGRELVNTSYAPDRPEGEELPALRDVAETGRPLISDLLIGGVSHRPMVAVSVPVFEGHRVRYVLSMGLSPEALSSILLEQKFSPSTVGAIYDRHGVVIARTRNPSTAVGAPGPAALLAATRSAPEGWMRDTTVDGVRA